METVFTFTAQQLLAGIVAVCVGFSGICGAAVWVLKIRRAVKAPDVAQDEQLQAHEKKLQEHDTYLANDKKRLDKKEEESRIIMRAILAMLDHNIDGNHVEPMLQSKEEINKYLISR